MGIHLSIYNRLKLIKITAVLGLFLSMLFSLNSWAGQRYFPVYSLIEGIQVLPPYDYVFPVVELLLLILLLFIPKPKLFIFLIVMVNVYFILTDINRLQSWLFVYNAILIVLFFYNWRIDNVNHYTLHFILLQILMAALYVHSGIQKFNPFFTEEVFPSVIKSLGNWISDRQLNLLAKMAYAIPIFEILAGLGILIKPLRFIAVPVLSLIHITLLLFTGFSGEKNTPMVWVWNLSMIFLILFLFTGKTSERFYSVTHLFKQPLFYLIILFFWIFPFLHLFNLYPAPLSFSFYSGNENQGELIINQKTYDNLPLYVRHFANSTNDGYRIDLQEWCMEELNIQIYNESFLYVGVQQKIQKITGSNKQDVKLVYIERQKMFAAQP